jgi:hypothetical protein
VVVRLWLAVVLVEAAAAVVVLAMRMQMLATPETLELLVPQDLLKIAYLLLAVQITL